MTHRPLVPVALAFITGIVVDHGALLPWWGWSAVLAPLLLAAVRWPPARMALVLGCVAACGAVAWRSHTSVPADHGVFHPAAVEGTSVLVRGRVNSDPETARMLGRGRKARFEMRLLSIDGQPASGRTRVEMFGQPAPRYGDELLMQGSFRSPPDFSSNPRLSAAAMLARDQVHRVLVVKKKDKYRVLARHRGPWLWGAALACRRAMNRVLAQYLSPGEAGLVRALVNGDRSGVPEHVREIFRRSGTTHILAVSGFNVGLAAAGAVFVLSLMPLPRAWRLGGAVLLTAWYAAVAGGGPPVVRAAVMSGLFLTALLWEREQEPLNTLAAAALMLLAANPEWLFDIGFQLSFAGVLSIALMAPVLAGLWPVARGARLFHEYIAVSVAAFFGTAGITAWYFGTVTPAALLANIPAVPLAVLVTMLSAVLLLLSPVPLLAALAALPLKAAVNLFVFVLHLFAQCPGGIWTLDPLPGAGVITIYYTLLFAATSTARRWSRPVDPRWLVVG